MGGLGQGYEVLRLNNGWAFSMSGCSASFASAVLNAAVTSGVISCNLCWTGSCDARMATPPTLRATVRIARALNCHCSARSDRLAADGIVRADGQ